MRRHKLLLILTVSCVACAAPQSFSAPAPASALRCAFGQASAKGYSPTAGGEADGFYRLERLNAGGGALFGRKSDNLAITMAAGTLRIEANGFDGDGDMMGPSTNAQQEARDILAACAP